MITHCPSCQTHFRVYAEQLAARAGQVRCGRCNRVFDALEHLIEEIAPPRAIEPKPEFDDIRVDTAETESAPEPSAAQTRGSGEIAQEGEIVKKADARRDFPELDAEAPQNTAQTQGFGELAQGGETTRREHVRADFREPEAETPHATGSESVASGPANFDTEAIVPASTFDFGPTVTVESAKPKRRWPWLVGAVLLLLLLLAQAAYQYRSILVVTFPETKPYAAALCVKLGCDLPLPRRIELMSIEGSDLQSDTANPSIMVLSATIKNRARFNQQYPSLELTLTDAQDQPVARRVLAPQNFLGAAVNTQAGFVASTEIVIKVQIEGSQVKAAGYRLYLFYP